jgi:hypothetical protein
MVYRYPHAAPKSRVPAERQGRVVGYFCLVCSSIFPLHRARHSGKPVYGRDHVASSCAHEGDRFEPGANWWDNAVEVLPEAAAGDPGIAGSPAKGTEPSATGPAVSAGPATPTGPAGPAATSGAAGAANAPGKGTEPTAPGVAKP